ncbi:MAG: sugar ABC transporter permease, partial [Synergistales bacterium]|nr:sugar ABC transporter permease [Synergistales bacterium]
MAVVTRARVGLRGVSWARVGSYLAKTWPLYIMLVPGLVQLAIFHYYPMYGVVIAFQNFNPGLGFAKSPWVGLDNYRYIFATPDFKNILWNTFIIAVSKILTVQFSAVVLAVLLNEIKSLFIKRSIQTIVYLPHFLSWVVLGGILIDMMGARGIIGRLISAFGMQPPMFLASNIWFRPVLIITELWKTVGWASIIYLASLMGIDPQLYEAAAIDGANRWQRIRYVTLPGIASTVVLIACLNLGNVLQAGFEQILMLYNPAVYRTGDILDTYVYRAGLISARYSVAGAIGLFKSALGFILII